MKCILPDATLQRSATNFSHNVLTMPRKGHRVIRKKYPYSSQSNLEETALFPLTINQYNK